jgi:hypothetical protein
MQFFKTYSQAYCLTLSYSPEGSPALAVFRPHYLYIVANYTGFHHNCFFISCGDIGLKESLDLVLAWKSGRKLPFLPLGRSCPLQTILLGDLVRCDSPLPIWRTIIVSRGLSTPDPESSNSNKKGAKLPFISVEGCHTRLDGQHSPLISLQ